MGMTSILVPEATVRILPGSLVITVTRSATADWIAAPIWASATDTPVLALILAATFTAIPSRDMSAMWNLFANAHALAVRSQPASTRTDAGTPIVTSR